MQMTFQKISLCDIRFDDIQYKISRPGPSQHLAESVQKLGVLDSPLLMETSSGFVPVVGHNRLAAARMAGIDSIICGNVIQPDNNWFLSLAALKLFRGELGPIGRLKAVRIIVSERLAADTVDVLRMTSVLEIPSDILEQNIDQILSLDPALLDYCDDKNISYKNLVQLTLLPQYAKEIMAVWTASRPVKMNYFRSALEYLSEIQRKNGAADADRAAAVLSSGIADESIIDALYGELFPVYSAMKNNAGVMTDEYRKNGVELKYPAFFEGDYAECSVRIRRRDGGASFRKSLDFLNRSDIKSVLELL